MYNFKNDIASQDIATHKEILLERFDSVVDVSSEHKSFQDFIVKKNNIEYICECKTDSHTTGNIVVEMAQNVPLKELAKIRTYMPRDCTRWNSNNPDIQYVLKFLETLEPKEIGIGLAKLPKNHYYFYYFNNNGEYYMFNTNGLQKWIREH